MTGLERVDISKVLFRLGIDAKRKSKEWFALCPNPDHEDRHPSWRLRDEPGSSRHGFHKCWPCGFGGSLVELVRKLKGIATREEARAWILEGVPVDQREVGEVTLRVCRAFLGFSLPDEVRFGPVEEWPGPARDYVLGRGIEPWQVDRWGIGYAVEGRLRGRVVFVLRDARGRPRGYSARSFDDGAKRFLEPEAAERASPSAMFGEQHWPSLEERLEAPVFVFEGAIKSLAAERALPGCFVAATTGSEERPLHVAKLATFGFPCLVGDDDLAGDRLSSRLFEGLARHANPSRLVLPADPDELPTREVAAKMLGWWRTVTKR